jgi:protein-tyrosine phosphatase
VQIEDSENVNIARYFDECVEFIQAHIKQGKVLIHCQLGQSRYA